MRYLEQNISSSIIQILCPNSTHRPTTLDVCSKFKVFPEAGAAEGYSHRATMLTPIRSETKWTRPRWNLIDAKFLLIVNLVLALACVRTRANDERDTINAEVRLDTAAREKEKNTQHCRLSENVHRYIRI